jgi:glucose-1-phosphate cytidylyltransferase
MKVVILCGGKGTRMYEETEYKPKPLVNIGGVPILIHIMEHYSNYGFNEFVLCLGYKGEMIKEYFMSFDWMVNDFTLTMKKKVEKIIKYKHKPLKWKIHFVDTGLDSLTGLRLLKVKDYLDDEFMMTYGDGISNVNINKLIEFHRTKKRIATITGVHPMSPYGIIEVKEGIANSFKEKPRLEGMVNGGFMVLDKKALNYIEPYENCMFEDKPLMNITNSGQLAVYEHNGFWKAMDTYKDVQMLNKMYEENKMV